MNQLIDRIIILILGVVIIMQKQTMLLPVVTALLAFCISSIIWYVENKQIKKITIAGYLFLCIFVPQFTIFIPLIVYDCLREKIAWSIAFAIPMLLYIPSDHLNTRLLWVASLLLSLLLSYRTKKIEILQRNLISLTDTSKELNLALREKNRSILERQDSEIYMATLRERNRIAREIHDHVGHMLSRAIIQIGALMAIYKEEGLQEHLNSINQTLNLAMTNIRESVHDLHEDSIDLPLSLEDMKKTLKKNCAVMIEYDASKHIPRKVKYCFISIVKEAISNINKHSNAQNVHIVVREHPSFYQLAIEDDGTSLSKELLKDNIVENLADNKYLHNGIGLSNMRDRVESLQGTFHINTERGFKIFVSIRKEDN